MTCIDQQDVAGLNYLLYQSENPKIKAHVIKASLQKFNLAIIPAIGQREEVSSITRRNKAIAGINGSNYRKGGRYNGNRLNLLKINSDIYTDLNLKRGCLAFNATTKACVIDVMKITSSLHIDGTDYPVDRINQPRQKKECVLYNTQAKKSLLYFEPGYEVVVENNKIIALGTQDSTKIPKNGFIYQIDYSADNIMNFRVGMDVILNNSLELSSKNHTYPLTDFDFILGGAGLLVKDGYLWHRNLYEEFSQGNPIVHMGDEVAANLHDKNYQHAFIEERHPRSAVGIDENNTVYLVVIDGRQNASEGMSLEELATFMKQLGCSSALNLGGGGCSTMVINDNVVNLPSQNIERPVSEALCLVAVLTQTS